MGGNFRARLARAGPNNSPPRKILVLRSCTRQINSNREKLDIGKIEIDNHLEDNKDDEVGEVEGEDLAGAGGAAQGLTIN